MKKQLACAVVITSIFGQSLSCYAEEFYNRREKVHGHFTFNGYGHGGYGHGGHGGHGHGHHGNDGAAILLGISASLLSLSALDTAQRSYRMHVIQHAETDALNYSSDVNPTPAFVKAKATIEELQGQEMNNDQAAIMIVELNQKFREE